MNSDEQSPPIQPGQPQTQISSVPEPQYGRRRTSKIGRLPKVIRDQINFLLLDGVPHSEIPKIIGDAAKDITETNIGKWATGAFPLWLKEYQNLQETRVKQEVAMDMAAPDGGSLIHEGTLQLAATTLSEMVRKLDVSDFKELLRDDPAKLIPFLNALATISNAELKCERHRLELEERRARLNKDQSDQKQTGLRPQTRQSLEDDLNLM